MRLTVKDRMLLHLFEHRKQAEAPEAPSEITREGIARATGIALRHVTQYVRPLLREGLVRERLSHVKGGRQRRRVYDLTDAGSTAAVQLRQRVKALTVRLRDGTGTRETTVEEALEATGGKASLLAVLQRATEVGTVDLADLTSTPSRAPVEMTADAPSVPRFVGRRRELKKITEGSGARLFVVRGLAGIGKTSLAARCCEILRGRRNLFWHRVRPWDTRVSLLSPMGEFLSAAGRPGLRAVVARGEAGRADAVLREDLAGTQSFLVFDDVHEASPEALPFFRMLVDAIASADDVRALVLTRKTVPFYNRRDVVLRKVVEEVELGGLDSHEVAEYVEAHHFPRTHVAVARRLRGHPLSLELLRAHNPAQGAVPDAFRYLEEEVYGTLSAAERGMMKVASLYRVPVPSEALFVDPGWPRDVLLTLQERALIRPVGDDRDEVHDTVREFFSKMTTPTERRVWGGLATTELWGLGANARAAGEHGLCASYLSNALQLETDTQRKAELWEALGDANRRVGDLLAVSVAYRSAARLAREGEVVVRLHRKIAEALLDWGNVREAGAEVEKALRILGERASVERGWLDLVRCRVARGLVGKSIQEAGAYAEGALRVFREFRERHGEAEALVELAEVAGITGSERDGRSLADEHFRLAMDLSNSLGDVDLEARIRYAMITDTMYRIGDANLVLAHLAKIESLPSTAQNPQRWANYSLARARFNAFARADFLAASADLIETTRAAREIRDESILATATHVSAFIAICQESVGKARRGFEESAEANLRLGALPSAYISLFNAALCILMEKDLKAFRRARDGFSDPRLTSTARYLRLYGEVVQALDHFVSGRPNWTDDFERALQWDERELRPRSHDFIVQAPRVLVAYGAALTAAGQASDGEAHIRRALRLLEERNLWGMREFAAMVAARLPHALEQLVQARA